MSKYFNNRFAPKIVSRRMRMTGNDFAHASYMADQLNIPNCATQDTQFNTGVPLCDLIKKKLIGVIFADSGASFSAADRASATAFVAALKTKTTAARGSRMYPLWNIRNMDDQTSEPQKGGVGNLTTAQVNTSEAIPAYLFGYKSGELQHQILAMVESGNYDVYLVDEAFTVYGTKSGTTMVGFSTEQIYVNISKFPVSDFVNQYSFSVTFASAIEWKSASAFMVTNSTITTAVGLVNVTATVINSATNVHKVQLVAAGGTNMQEVYTTAISGLSWTAKKRSDGSSVTVSGTTNNATDKCYNVTIDSTAWSGLSTGDIVDIYGPTPSALSGASVAPYEIFSCSVTK